MKDLLGKIRLLGGLIQGEWNYADPAYLNLGITRRCNLHCPGCQFHTTGREGAFTGDRSTLDLPLETVERLADEIRQMGIQQVIIAGEGEPLLHPQFFEIIKVLKRTGTLVQVFTNGTLIRKIGLGRMVDSGLDRLYVSLWVSDAAAYQSLYGIPGGMFDEIIASLKELNLQKAGRAAPQITITGPVLRSTVTRMDERIRLAAEIGPGSAVNFTVYRGVIDDPEELGEQDRRMVLENMPGLSQLAEKLGVRHNLRELAMRYELGEKGYRDTPCYAAWFQASVRADGSLTTCGWCSYVYGNLHQNSLKQIWNGEAIRDFRRMAWVPPAWLDVERTCNCEWCCFSRDIQRVHAFMGPLESLQRARFSGKR